MIHLLNWRKDLKTLKRYCRTTKYLLPPHTDSGASTNTSNIQGVPKKMSFSGKTAITTFKLIQSVKVGGVLEYSGYLLPDGH